MLQRCSLKNGQRDAPTARVSQRLPETRLVTLLLRHTYTHVDRCAATKKKRDKPLPTSVHIINARDKVLTSQMCESRQRTRATFHPNWTQILLAPSLFTASLVLLFFFPLLFLFSVDTFFFKVLLKGIVTKSTVTEMEKKKAKWKEQQQRKKKKKKRAWSCQQPSSAQATKRVRKHSLIFSGGTEQHLAAKRKTRPRRLRLPPFPFPPSSVFIPLRLRL